MPAQTHLFLCLKDNYGVLLHDPASGATAAIDAPEAAPVEAALKATGWKLTDILVTHHHQDHTGGIAELKQRHRCRVVAPHGEAARIPLVDETVRENDKARVGGLEGARDRDARPHRRPHRLRFPSRQARLRRRHAVLDRLWPRHRGHARDDVAVAAEAPRRCRTTPASIAATNTRRRMSDSPAPSSPTIRRWRRARRRSSSSSPRASRRSPPPSARKRPPIRSCAPISRRSPPRSASPASRRRRSSPRSASARTTSSSGPDESAPISPLSFRDGLKGRARNPYSQPVVMDSGLAPPKSAVADLGTIDCRSRVNPRSVARPGMTRMVQYQRNAL